MTDRTARRTLAVGDLVHWTGPQDPDDGDISDYGIIVKICDYESRLGFDIMWGANIVKDCSVGHVVKVQSELHC